MNYRSVAWVHPSWRDLVIDEISRDATARRAFLSQCGRHGVELALSIGGGSTGSRSLPFLVDEADWNTLQSRVSQLLENGDAPDALAIMRSLANVTHGDAATSAWTAQRWNTLVKSALS